MTSFPMWIVCIFLDDHPGLHIYMYLLILHPWQPNIRIAFFGHFPNAIKRNESPHEHNVLNLKCYGSQLRVISMRTTKEMGGISATSGFSNCFAKKEWPWSGISRSSSTVDTRREIRSRVWTVSHDGFTSLFLDHNIIIGYKGRGGTMRCERLLTTK